MDIPLEKAIPAVLRQGNVFYFVDSSIPSTDPHNYVLLSRQPTSEKKLVVAPQDYRDFTCETMFDCFPRILVQCKTFRLNE